MTIDNDVRQGQKATPGTQTIMSFHSPKVPKALPKGGESKQLGVVGVLMVPKAIPERAKSKGLDGIPCPTSIHPGDMVWFFNLWRDDKADRECRQFRERGLKVTGPIFGV